MNIDQLYYGDENNRFVSSVPDDGRKIVNSVYLLWQKGVLISNIFSESKVNNKIHITYNGDVTLACYNEQIVWLLNRLGEFNQKKDSFPDPDAYIEMILSSAVNEINKRIKSAEELRNTPRLSIGSSK
ncbi:MAG: hypothetical protein K5766_03340 [Alphaproteobacteria bacterium]|nr:hypothetical protein [Alphaproteobacteria bacterium]